MRALMNWRLVCQHEERNTVVLVFMMLIQRSWKDMGLYPVEPFYHSIWLWMEHCSSILLGLQLLAHLWQQIPLEVPSFVCAQLQWDPIMWDTIFHKDFGYFWGIFGWYWILLTICWSNWPRQEYIYRLLLRDIKMIQQDTWLFLQTCVPHCTCNLPWLLHKLYVDKSNHLLFLINGPVQLLPKFGNCLRNFKVFARNSIMIECCHVKRYLTTSEGNCRYSWMKMSVAFNRILHAFTKWKNGCESTSQILSTQMTGPLSSRDLNPLWTELEEHACAQRHQNLNSWKAAIVKTTREIPLAMIRESSNH